MQYIGRTLALRAISFYQRFISPYKGFRCAYGYHTGCASCSRLGYRAIRWRGVAVGVRLLFQRFARCREVYEKHQALQKAETPSSAARRDMSRGPGRLQRGFCDAFVCVPDASCAAPCDVDLGSAACDALNCCGSCSPSPCDLWPQKKSRAANRLQLFVDSR